MLRVTFVRPKYPFYAVLNRCLYNVADKSSKGNARKYDDEISELKKHLNKIAMWLSLFVQNSIGYFTDNEHYHQVLLPRFR